MLNEMIAIVLQIVKVQIEQQAEYVQHLMERKIKLCQVMLELIV